MSTAKTEANREIPGLFAAWAKELDVTCAELRRLIDDKALSAAQMGTLADVTERMENAA